MNKKRYNEIVLKNTPKEKLTKNFLFAFFVGGFIGLIGQGLVNLYIYLFDITTKDAGLCMIITLITVASVLTALNVFDKLVYYARCGLIVPITGFAHAMTSSAMDYRKEGLITGIGSNIFKLTGSVILYGIVSSYIVGIIRLVFNI